MALFLLLLGSMTSASTEKSLKLSFADRFSKIKRRSFMVLWMLSLVLLYRFLGPTIKNFYAITKSQESYYLVTVIDDMAFYDRVTNKPEAWVPLDQISKKIQGAIISSEDGKFYEHPGYDLEQMTEVIDKSVKTRKQTRNLTRNLKPKKIRGASTITQQLVKNLFLSTDRTLFRKAQEFLMAVAIEKHADKKKILETYLNVIEYGKGIYGIGNATKYYFNKKPNQVTAREAAFLAMLLPSPVKYSKSFQMKSLTPFASRMVESILQKMRQGGYIGDQEQLEQMNARFSWEKEPDATLANTDISEEENL
jgi:monofunctional biosynthetic peptidoglycan transglycosylase